MKRILVWDWPTRIGHWLLAGGFVVALLTGESEEWRYVHAVSGGVVVAVIVFRLAWGIFGTRHARFTAFLRGPRAAFEYVRSLVGGSPRHYSGHNPAGAYAILALLVLGLITGASGWLAYQDQGADWIGELHEAFANAMLAAVVVHLVGVAVGSFVHRENLPRAMVTGRKLGDPGEAIRSARPLALGVMLAWVGYAAWWLAR
jgi:cytochrome b